jgi:hypothetical protein
MAMDAINSLNIVQEQDLPKVREYWEVNASDANATTHEPLKAAVSGQSHYITEVILSAAAATTLAIEDGATTIIGPVPFPATGGNVWHKKFKDPIKITEGVAINVLQVGATAFNVIIRGFTGKKGV